MVLGTSRTAVFPPLSLVVDIAQYPSHQSGTYWAAGEGRWVSAARSSSFHLNCRSVPGWMDAVFTNLVVRPLPGALWWAAWCMENRVLILVATPSTPPPYPFPPMRNKENGPIVIMPTHPKLTQVPRVIHDILDVLCRPQGSYAESFVLLSLLLADL